MSVSLSKSHDYPSMDSFERSLNFPLAFLPFASIPAGRMHDIAAVQLREAVERRDARATEKIMSRLKSIGIDLGAFLNERSAKGLTYLEEAVRTQPAWMLRGKTPEEQGRESRRKNSSLRLVEPLVENGAGRLQSAMRLTYDPAIVYYLKETARKRLIDRTAQRLPLSFYGGYVDR